MQKKHLDAITGGREGYFYKSWAWQKKRREVLKRDNYECQRCKRLGRVSKGEVVHHIKELKDRPDLGMTTGNLISVCYQCHNVIHERFEGKKSDKQIKIPEKW